MVRFHNESQTMVMLHLLATALGCPTMGLADQ